MNVKYHYDLEQGSDEWLAVRRGLLTASEMKLIMTSSWKPASNDKERAHLYELLAQRITGYVEPHYIGDDMLRGHEDEVEAKILYAERYAPVENVGFITNDRWGFTLGYSPDGLVGDDGLIEVKSRRQKYQVQTVIENVMEDTIPPDFAMQIQTGILVSERKWCDFISYSGGLPMVTITVFPIPELRDLILESAAAFEARLAKKLEQYNEILASGCRLLPTERRVELEMFV